MAAHCDSRRMSASSIFPIRWTPVPVTVSPDATASSSNPRPHWDFSRLKLQTRARNLLTSAWLNVKNIFDRSRQEDPVRYTEQLAEAYPSYPCIYPQDSFCLHHMLSTDLSLSLNSLKDTDGLPVLMSGAICSHLYGSNVDGTISSDIAMESPKTSQIQPKKSFDRDWKEIRHRLERKIAAAATQAISGRPGGADNRSRSKSATPPKQKESRFYRVKNEDKLTTRGANPRTGMVSPSNRTDSSDEDLVPRPRLSQKWKVNGDQWVSVDVGQTTSSRSSPLSFKLAKTVSSAGSGSTDISSSDDWEDRFVVHMPSADDPNPPSMTAEQIRLYQKKMTMLHGVAEPRHEMDASKPSSGSPEPKHTQQTMTTSFIPVLKKGTASNSFSSDSCPSISPPLEGRHQYFSPDEVGRARVSPSADIAKLKQKERVKKLREECFLGCLGVDEKAAKNPDEILLFPNSDDEMDLQISPLTKSDEESDKIKTSSTLRMSQKSKLPLSAGHNIAKSTQTQWAGNLVIPPVLTPAQQTKIPVPSSASPSAVLGKVREGDGVVLTSTSTSTSAGASKVGLQRSRARSALKLPSRPPKFTKDHSRRTPEDDLFFESYFSGPSPGTSNSPAESTKSVPSGLEGEQASTITPSPSTDPIRRNLNDKSKHGHSPASQLRQASSPTATGAPNGLTIDPETPKRQHVAELDGLQVPQQLPSPPLSTSPSPPPAKIKPETVATNENPPIKGKRNTHTIRMEIRMKAEKARQGAAAAKSASERLAAARKHAERVAEARVAYEKAKSQSSTVPKKKETPDELELQRLNTERINEARKAFKAAQAKQAERQAEREAKRESEKQAKREAEKEAKREAEKAARREAELLAKREAEKDAARRAEIRRKEARVKSETRIPTCSSSKKKVEPTISPKEAKSTQKPARKSAVRRQPSPEKKSKRDTKVDDPEISVPTTHSEPCLNDTALNLSMLSLSFSKLHTFLRDHDLFSQILLFCERLLQMASHCFKVCKLLVEAWLQYKETGSLSQPAFDHHQELGDFAADVGQALVNFAVLCFVLVVVVKVVGYILIVTNWMVWLCRPIGWVFGNLLSAVM